MASFDSDPRIQQERVLVDLRRRFIVGDDADPVLSSCPLDVMLARRVRGANGLEFGHDHHAAGEWFLRLYRYRSGGCKLKGCLDVSMHINTGEHEKPHMDAQYRALARDRRLSAEKIDMLADVIVFGIWPMWLSAIVAGKQETGGRELFMAVLDTLRKIWIEYGTWSGRVQPNR